MLAVPDIFLEVTGAMGRVLNEFRLSDGMTCALLVCGAYECVVVVFVATAFLVCFSFKVWLSMRCLHFCFKDNWLF